MGNEEKIKALEEELQRTPYNKATSHHLGLLKARIAKLKRDVETASKKGGAVIRFAVKKTGDATVLLVGFPSVGKSTLLNALTAAESKVAAYEFTTLDVIPGMLEHRGARIQILDVPGIIEGAATGKGRGREVLSAVRSSDLVLIMVDKSEQLETIYSELYKANLRLNARPPDVVIRRKSQGGLALVAGVRMTRLSEEFARDLMKEYGLLNADVVIRQDVTADELIDVLAGNRHYVPALVVLNKADLHSRQELDALRKKIGECVVISADKGAGLAELKDRVFEKLRFIRVFMKRIGHEADMREPLIMRQGDAVRAVCERIHKDFVKKFQYARVWGPTARFGGQAVGIEHPLADGSVVELHIER